MTQDLVDTADEATPAPAAPWPNRARAAVLRRLDPRSFPDPRDLPEWWRGKQGQRIHIVAVLLLTLVTTAIYAVYLLMRYYNGDTGLLDLGIYDQAIRSYAHFTGPHSPVVGLVNAHDLGNLQLSDHFTPLLMAFVPFYWIHDSPTTLLVGTAVLCAAAIPPIWMFTRRALGTTAAYLVAVVYAVAWETQAQLWFAFHEVAFTAPIIAWMLERAQAGKRRQAAAISLILLLVKDDMGFLVAAFGIYLLFSKGWSRPQWMRRERLLGAAALVVGGFAMVLLVNKVLIPYFGGSPQRNWTYQQYGSSPGQMVKYMLEHPLRVFHNSITPAEKTETLLWLFLPVLFLSLLSPITLLGLPLLAERYLSNNTMYWGMDLHYNSFLTVILLLGAVDGAARLCRWAARVPAVGAKRAGLIGLVWALGATAVSLDSMPRWQMWEMTTSAFWHSTRQPEVIAERKAAAKVPDGALVASVGNAGVFLLDRTTVFMWSYPGDRTTVIPPWVVANVKHAIYPFRTVQDQIKQVNELKAAGYVAVYQRDGYVVLHHP